MHRGSVPAFLCLCLLLLPVSLTAQPESERSRIWLGIGLGSGASSRDGGMAFVGQLAWHRRPHAITLRTVGVFDFFDADSGPFGDFGLLYGRTSTGPFGHVSLSAGVAATGFESGCERPGGCTVIGVPIAAEAALRILPIFGLGAELFANLNTEAVFGGLAVFVQLGWLPNRR